MRRLLPLLVTASLTLLSSACATRWVLDTEVRQFTPAVQTNTSNPQASSFEFERLPSQQTPTALSQQTNLEAAAQAVLQKLGFTRAANEPRYLVQINAQHQTIVPPWWDQNWPPAAYWPRAGSVFLPPPLWRPGIMPRLEPPWYRHQIRLSLRERSSAQIVYEGHAYSDGPWANHAQVYALLFQAALDGFPKATPGPRAVRIEQPAP